MSLSFDQPSSSSSINDDKPPPPSSSNDEITNDDCGDGDDDRDKTTTSDEESSCDESDKKRYYRRCHPKNNVVCEYHAEHERAKYYKNRKYKADFEYKELGRNCCERHCCKQKIGICRDCFDMECEYLAKRYRTKNSISYMWSSDENEENEGVEDPSYCVYDPFDDVKPSFGDIWY